nr:8924_t:CDS:2 [Entrophospora candida]
MIQQIWLKKLGCELGLYFNGHEKDGVVKISKINWNDSGSQPKMRDTVFDDSEQKMVHPDGKQKNVFWHVLSVKQENQEIKIEN